MISAPNGRLITIRPPCFPAYREGKVELIYSQLMCHCIKNNFVWHTCEYHYQWARQSESSKGLREVFTETADSRPEGPTSSLPRAGSVKGSEFPFLSRPDPRNQPSPPEGHYQLKGVARDMKHVPSLSLPPQELCIAPAIMASSGKKAVEAQGQAA